MQEDVNVVTSEFTWKPDIWFSYPEYSSLRKSLEPKCWDGHHLLVKCRVKVCKDGLPGFGVNRDAWVFVSEKAPDVLSKSLVIDLLDKQSNAFARRTFSKEVEAIMSHHGYCEEAKFCRLIRNWYLAEDEPELSSSDRLRMRIEFRDYLLSKSDLSQFPPHGRDVGGMPRGMYEGFLQSIDTHIQLHAVVKGGACNTRSVSSLANETFFGEMAEHKQNLAPKATKCGRLMSIASKILHYRHNTQNRSFAMRLSRNTVYESHKCDGVSLKNEDPSSKIRNTNVMQTFQVNKDKITNDIYILDHFFDTPERRRVKQRRAKDSDIGGLHGVMTGERGVREHHRAVKSKILPTDLIGLKI